MLSANQFARRGDYPADYRTAFGDDPQTVVSGGGSCIIGPLGEVLAGPDFSGETILTAEIDLHDIARARLDFDAVGHYARPDIFRLIVDESNRRPVTFHSEPDRQDGPPEVPAVERHAGTGSAPAAPVDSSG